MMSVMTVMIVMVAMMMTVSMTAAMRRAEAACYYQPYYKQLTCTCPGQGEAFLSLKLGHHIRQLGQEVGGYIIVTESFNNTLVCTLKICRGARSAIFCVLSILERCKYPSVLTRASLSLRGLALIGKMYL